MPVSLFWRQIWWSLSSGLPLWYPVPAFVRREREVCNLGVPDDFSKHIHERPGRGKKVREMTLNARLNSSDKTFISHLCSLCAKDWIWLLKVVQECLDEDYQIFSTADITTMTRKRYPVDPSFLHNIDCLLAGNEICPWHACDGSPIVMKSDGSVQCFVWLLWICVLWEEECEVFFDVFLLTRWFGSMPFCCLALWRHCV